MLNISRENAIKLISDIRKVNEKEIDFKKYQEDSSLINNMVQTAKFMEKLKDYLFVHAED